MIGFIIGFISGAPIGFFISCLIIAAKIDDRDDM